MQLFIDSGNLGQIKKVAEWLPLDGVSVNPTLVAREKKELFPLVNEILEAVEGLVHVQVVRLNPAGIVAEAEEIHALNPQRVIVKIPVSRAGFEAMKLLQGSGMKITATAVYSVGQALAAAKLGAYVVAPYVSRVDRAGHSGMELVADMQDMLRTYGFATKVVAASVKTPQQFNELAAIGVDAVTMDPEVYEVLIHHPLTEQAITGFSADWDAVYDKASIRGELKVR